MFKEYNLKPNYTYFNGGARGVPPTYVLNKQQELRNEISQCPDCFYWTKRNSLLSQVQSKVANYLGVSDPKDIVFVINASHGINAVLRSLFEEMYNSQVTHSKIKFLYLDTAYPMVQNTLKFMHNTFSNENLLRINVTTEMINNDEILLQTIEKTIINETSVNNNTIFLAVFSHIASLPSMIYPVSKMIELCHNYGIKVLIDGAHVMGQIDLNITQLNPDFYVTNAHKWLTSARGSAILYVKKEYQNITFPTCISDEGVGDTSFQKWFNFQGTKLCF